MSEKRIPDFMQNKDRKPTAYSKALEAYLDKFGCDFSTFSVSITMEELINVLNACVESGIPFNEYLGLEGIGPNDKL